MAKTLVIANINQNKEKLKELLSKLNKKKTIILYLNNDIIDLSFKHYVLDDFFDVKDFPELEKEIEKLAKIWYKPIEKETMYFNIQLGEVIEFEFRKLWSFLLKIDTVLNTIKKLNPSRIFIITEKEEDIRIIKEIIKYNKLKIKLNYKKFEVQQKKNSKKLYSIVAKVQNYYFNLNSFRLKNKNKILFIGNLRQNKSVLKELKKNNKNIIIRAGEYLGKGFFNEHTYFYLTFKDIKNNTNKIKSEFIGRWMRKNALVAT